jgi:carboxylesterase type B
MRSLSTSESEERVDNETGTPRRRFLKQASLVLAEAQAGVLLPFLSVPDMPSVGQARSSSAAGSDLVVDTLSGKVRGTVQDGIRVFKGLIDWLTFPGGQAEDCLALNVWTPAVKDNVKRPVLVSFHGGGFTTGTGSNIFYNGHPLAKFGDVVVVTLNHRLGCLGYLSMADIGAPPEFAQAGVAGMMDCVLALEWVRDHIANFGGDPGKVMIFGQSGGGAKVTHLLAMPSARGLFHRAAIQSSGWPLRAVTRECAIRAAEQMLAQIGLTRKRATELQQVPVEMMLSAQASLAARDVPADFAPVLDGSVIPRHPFDPDAPAVSADVPVIVSTTLDDASAGRTDSDLDQAGLRGDVLDGDREVPRFERSTEHRLERACALHEDAVPAVVHHHLRDVVIEEQILNWLEEWQDSVQAAHSAPRSTWSK